MLGNSSVLVLLISSSETLIPVEKNDFRDQLLYGGLSLSWTPQRKIFINTIFFHEETLDLGFTNTVLFYITQYEHFVAALASKTNEIKDLEVLVKKKKITNKAFRIRDH